MVVPAPNETVAYFFVVWAPAYVGAVSGSMAGLEAFKALIRFREEVGVRCLSHEIHTVVAFMLWCSLVRVVVVIPLWLFIVVSVVVVAVVPLLLLGL